MKKYVILADVTCDVNQEIRDFIGMKDYVTGHASFDDGRDLVTTLDWEPISREEFYTALSNKNTKVTTAPPNIEEYYEKFEGYVKEGYGILSMALTFPCFRN